MNANIETNAIVTVTAESFNQDSFLSWLDNLPNGVHLTGLKYPKEIQTPEGDKVSHPQAGEYLPDVRERAIEVFTMLELDSSSSIVGMQKSMLLDLLKGYIKNRKPTVETIEAYKKGFSGSFEMKNTGTTVPVSDKKPTLSGKIGSEKYFATYVEPCLGEFAIYIANYFSDYILSLRGEIKLKGIDAISTDSKLGILFQGWNDARPERVENMVKGIVGYKERRIEEEKYHVFLAEKVPFPSRIEAVGDKGCKLIVDKEVFTSFITSSFVNYGFSWVGNPQQSDFVVSIPDMDVIPLLVPVVEETVTVKPVTVKPVRKGK